LNVSLEGSGNFDIHWTVGCFQLKLLPTPAVAKWLKLDGAIRGLRDNVAYDAAQFQRPIVGRQFQASGYIAHRDGPV
jgi:hypothetical protein